MNIYILNGPNLNLLGQREPNIYGICTLQDIEVLCEGFAKEHGFMIRFIQRNCEGALIDLIHEAREDAAAILINGAGYSHSSIAILDALKAFEGPVVEVHLSNIFQREEFRHTSYIAKRADAVISGCGVDSYLYGLSHIIKILKMSQKSTKYA